MCQYDLLVSGMCQSLKTHANSTLHTLYSKLDQVCDIEKPVITDEPTTSSPPPSTTSSMLCADGMEDIEVCAEEVEAQLDTYTMSDWRREDKVQAVCR